MSASDDILRRAGDLSERGEPFVLVTVVQAEGSTPRDAGARMIWREGDFAEGTVGGGQFEHLVRDDAERHLKARTCGLETYTLGKDADQCCGGRVTVFIEYIGPRQRLVVFGAGHVAQELVGLVSGSPFEIVVADDRPDWNSSERFPHARRELDLSEAVSLATESPDATLACVMTCSHETDFDLLRKLLESPPAYLGLIGSRSKRTSFFTRLAASGIGQDRIERITCPMGVGDTGKSPREVAISIAGQLLIESKRLGTL